MTHINGFDPARDLPAIEFGKIEIEAPIDPAILAQPAFDQRAHDLMLQSIDKIAADWVRELQHVRDNCNDLEQLVLKRVAKVKADVTQLYLLGSAAVTEGKRTDELNHKIADELDKLAEEVRS